MTPIEAAKQTLKDVQGRFPNVTVGRTRNTVRVNANEFDYPHAGKREFYGYADTLAETNELTFNWGTEKDGEIAYIEYKEA